MHEEKLQKNKVMEETIELLMTENKQLKLQIQDKEEETKWEIDELKIINQQLKDKFKF